MFSNIIIRITKKLIAKNSDESVIKMDNCLNKISCSCCAYRKPYFCEKGRMVLMSNHGRRSIITKEIIEEMKKYKTVETTLFFNQPLAVNERKRKREESFIDKVKKMTHRFFKEELEIGFPEGVEVLLLGLDFNYPVDNLPSTIKKIKFGINFNHPINNLPNGVVKIKFERISFFNHPIDFLPSSLEFLELSSSFNHPLTNLPNSLKYLRIGKAFDHDLNNLPDSLEKLILPNTYLREIKNFPKNLKKIVISKEYPYPIPDSIKRQERISMNFYKFNHFYFSNVAYLKEKEQTKSIRIQKKSQLTKTKLEMFLAP